MKPTPVLLLLTIFLLALTACMRDDPEPANDRIEFRVFDEITGMLIADAKIQLLEDGPIVTTDEDGIGTFQESDLTGAEIRSITDSVAYAFSITHPDFHIRELNASPGKERVIVNLLPDSTGKYFYHRPVQLDDGLQTGLLSDGGFDSARMQQLMVKIATPGYRELHSLLIYKDNRMVLEEYYFGNNDTINFEGGVTRDRSPEPIWWSRKEEHYMASVNKALTSTVTGIALEAHSIGTDALIKDYLPDYAGYFEGDANKSGVTFHHALNMTLGFEWDEWGSNDLVQLWKSDDFAEFMLSRPNNGPGSEWYYNSASPNVILKCLEQIVGGSIRTWAHEHFYAKLGITDYRWQSQPDGYPEGAARMYLRPRDMLKIGITYLNNGQWDGEQVVPASWVEKCLQVEETPESGNYSHFFWVRELGGVTYLSADGDGGNFINIFPDQNMVIVITQGNYLAWPLYVTQANDLMGNYILPALE